MPPEQSSTETLTVAVGVVPLGPAPGEDAVTVTLPGEIAVTRPREDTVAMASLLDRHWMVLPASGCPPASRAVAVSASEAPAGIVPPSGWMVMLATGSGSTDTIDVPILPSPMAVIVAWPTVTPVTRPALLTVAMLGALEVHSRGRFAMVAPVPSSASPCSARV